MVNIPRSQKPKKTITKKPPRRWGRRKLSVVEVKDVNKLVKTAIANNVENKQTDTKVYINPVSSCTSTGIKWLNMSSFHSSAFGGTGLFEITRGTQQNHRIGNIIKLKRWVIKGHICPRASGYAFTESNFLVNTMQGYITVYFGKRKDGGTMDNALPNLLQSGAFSVTPNGSAQQIFYTQNNDYYKIYWKKRFKMSPAYMMTSSTTVTPNNDFDTTRTFGFDVCKYICKNLKINFDDQVDQPTNSILNDLALFAIWTPAVGDMALNPVGYNSYYQIVVNTYAEYEDA